MLFRLHWGLPYRFAIVFFFTCGTFAMRHTTLTTVHPLTDVEWLKLGMYTDRIVSSDFSDRIQSDPIRPDPTNPTIRSDYPKLRMIFMYRWYAGLIASFWEKLMRRPTHHGGATSSRFMVLDGRDTVPVSKRQRRPLSFASSHSQHWIRERYLSPIANINLWSRSLRTEQKKCETA